MRIKKGDCIGTERFPGCGKKDVPITKPSLKLCISCNQKRLGPKKRSRIKPVSEKRADENKIYLTKRRAFLKGKKCAVFPELKATQIHHMKGRLGPLFLDENYWLPVSASAHRKIEDNPDWAYKKGYSLSRQKKF